MRPKAGQAPLVTVIVPGVTSVAGTINATGTLAAKHDMPIGVVGEGGVVRRCWSTRATGCAGPVAGGDRPFGAGQQEANRSQVRVAEADARIAQANLDRALKLVSAGFISNADIDKLTAVRDAADARVRVAQANWANGARIRRLNIVAPADGLVLDRAVEPGQVVSGGRARCSALPKWRDGNAARLSETDLAHMALGQEVKVRRWARPRPFGHVWQVSP
jgi:hypothetical protein